MDDAVPKPRIELWYGKNQAFGHAGQAQRWVNILGRVYASSPRLTYSLNAGTPVKLSVGPDQRRLVGKGDFNIDLDIRDLIPGTNKIEIVAIDENGNEAKESVSFVHSKGDAWLPYRIDWGSIENIQTVAQVVDGLWSIQDHKISPVEIGYDRLIAIGDREWRDYEVTVPITLHGYNGSCYQYPSIHAGVGVIMRWRGHWNWGMDQFASGQPFFGPSPYGMIGWYCVFHEEGSLLNFFDPDFKRAAAKKFKMVLHRPYIFKIRVETLKNGKSVYSLKAWDKNLNEPAKWDLTVDGIETGLREGSIVLGAHHVSASFGTVCIDPV